MTELRRDRGFSETAEAAPTSTTYSTTTSTTTRDTEPGVFCGPDDLETIRETYAGVLGGLNLVKARDIEQALTKGVQPSAILDAIEQTALAPRPSHAYLRAILRRYAAEGITTQAAAAADRERRRWKIETYKEQQRIAWYNPPAEDLFWTTGGR